MLINYQAYGWFSVKNIIIIIIILVVCFYSGYDFTQTYLSVRYLYVFFYLSFFLVAETKRFIMSTYFLSSKSLDRAFNVIFHSTCIAQLSLQCHSKKGCDNCWKPSCCDCADLIIIRIHVLLDIRRTPVVPVFCFWFLNWLVIRCFSHQLYHNNTNGYEIV